MYLFKNPRVILTLLLLVGLILRFWNSNWGAPFYFHPDERNIANSVTGLQFPHQLNPHFFAYGVFPIYAIYFLAVIINFCLLLLTHQAISTVFTIPFPLAILTSRVFSVFFSLGIIYLLFKLGKKLANEKVGILTAFLATFSVGFMQFAHFGTFEMWLSFFSLWLFDLCLLVAENPTLLRLVTTTIITAFLIGIKVSSIALVPLPFVALLLGIKKFGHLSYTKRLTKGLLLSFVFFVLLITLSCIFTPFLFLDRASFLNSMNYETSIATGKELVFYTGEFSSSIPIVFQLLHVLPFLVNPVNETIFFFCFIFMLFLAFKKKNTFYLLLLLFFLDTYISQSLLFVKWTRYIVWSLSFFYLIISCGLLAIFTEMKNNRLKKYVPIVFGTIAFAAIIFGFSYIVTAFIQQDTRILAANWTKKHIKVNTQIMSEVYDLGITAFPQPNIHLVDTYAIETNGTKELSLALVKNSVIILPSQRVLKIRTDNKQTFPVGNKFYTQLQSGQLGFKKVYQTPCDIFCQITYLGNPVYSFEETATVFDRPTIFIYQKMKNYNESYYQKLL